MKPTLFLLAAGMGSRYGGLKQLDGLGPNGETIMDYSIYDAIKAGFGKLVFVIRKDFEQEFKDKIISKYEVIFHANWFSKHWIICRKASLVQKVVKSLGVQTMQ
jgi:CTP:molybdopterin cytidylyltransferase MocA